MGLRRGTWLNQMRSRSTQPATSLPPLRTRPYSGHGTNTLWLVSVTRLVSHASHPDFDCSRYTWAWTCYRHQRGSARHHGVSVPGQEMQGVGFGRRPFCVKIAVEIQDFLIPAWGSSVLAGWGATGMSELDFDDFEILPCQHPVTVVLEMEPLDVELTFLTNGASMRRHVMMVLLAAMTVDEIPRSVLPALTA
jgi:hypothetical protein